MIRMIQRVYIADCDACGKPLGGDRQDPVHNVNYGSLQSHFGWNSRLDHCDSQIPTTFTLCEKCWEKALRAVGLPSSYEDRRWWTHEMSKDPFWPSRWKKLKRPRNFRREEQELKLDMERSKRENQENERQRRRAGRFDGRDKRVLAEGKKILKKIFQGECAKLSSRGKR